MTVLVLGANGMLGHKLLQVLSERFDVAGTVREDAARWADHPVLGRFRLVGDVRVEETDSLVRAFAGVRPTVVINGVGIIKQLAAARDPIPSLTVNSLFPHRLAALAAAAGARVIHISTDCVFSGRKGGYVEDDVSDAEDLYGRTKFLGELGAEEGLTLRTSIVGRELGRRTGLFEWFIGQRGGSASGYSRAIYSGLTTRALATVIADLIERHPGQRGLWHVASEPIDKYTLLQKLDRALALGVSLRRDESFVCDRSLDGSRFAASTGIRVPGWDEMIQGLADDSTPYPSLFKD